MTPAKPIFARRVYESVSPTSRHNMIAQTPLYTRTQVTSSVLHFDAVLIEQSTFIKRLFLIFADIPVPPSACS